MVESLVRHRAIDAKRLRRADGMSSNGGNTASDFATSNNRRTLPPRGATREIRVSGVFQVPGMAIRMDVALFDRLQANRTFRQLLDRYVQAYVNMPGQLAACNRLHSVYERCSQWLLMTQDRVDSSEIPLTHEYLAMMLGTQRSGVTIAAGTLQKAGSSPTVTASSRSSIVPASKALRANATTSRENSSAACCDPSPASVGSEHRSRM